MLLGIHVKGRCKVLPSKVFQFCGTCCCERRLIANLNRQGDVILPDISNHIFFVRKLRNKELLFIYYDRRCTSHDDNLFKRSATSAFHDSMLLLPVFSFTSCFASTTARLHPRLEVAHMGAVNRSTNGSGYIYIARG